MRNGNWHKSPIDADLFLSDHTVAADDPRILNAIDAMTRVRRRTGFDAVLMRDKSLATKTTKDINIGLARVDQINYDRKLYELCYRRNVDAEKAALKRRLPHVTAAQRPRSKSVSFPPLQNERARLRQCFSNLSSYIGTLEAQGGFFGTDKTDCDVLKSGNTSPTPWSDADEYVTFETPIATNAPKGLRTSRRHSIQVSGPTLHIRPTEQLVRRRSDNDFTESEDGEESLILPPLVEANLKLVHSGKRLTRALFSAPHHLDQTQSTQNQ